MSDKSSSAKNRKKQAVRETPAILLYPLMAVLGIVPLIVKVHRFDCGLAGTDFFETAEVYYGHGGSADVFLYWKMVFFIIFASLMAAITVGKIVIEKRKIKFSKIFIPLGVYALLAIISSLASKYRHFAFTGIYEQFESLFALLGYCVVAYYAFLYINDEKDLKRVLWALVFSTVILMMIGISQAFFTDFYRTKFGSNLIAPVGEDGSTLAFNFEYGRAYLSLYNPNYVGSYTALLFPVFTMMAFATDKIWQRILFATIAVTMIVVLFASLSHAGMIGVYASIVLALLVFNKKLVKYWIPVVLTLAVVLSITVWYNHKNGGYIVHKIVAMFNSDETERTEADLKSITTCDDEIIFNYRGNKLHADLRYDYINDDFIIRFWDDAGNNVDYINIYHVAPKWEKALKTIGRKYLGIPMIYKYRDAIRHMLHPSCVQREVIPVITPNWDHTPRSGRKGLVFTDCKPQYFKLLASHAFAMLKDKPAEEQIVMLKSWNEWGEGNYMEPDLEYGQGYIDALSEAIQELNQ